MSQATITLQIDANQQLSLDQIATDLNCDRTDLIKQAIDIYLANYQSKRPAFGIMRHSGEILGDLLESPVSASDWEALQ